MYLYVICVHIGGNPARPSEKTIVWVNNNAAAAYAAKKGLAMAGGCTPEERN